MRNCFYQNFFIISKKMIDLIKRLDINIQNKIIKVKSIFDENRIIMLLDMDLINIYFYYYTDEIIAQYIIISDKAELLFKLLLTRGYEFLDKYLPNNKVKINAQYDTIDVIIYKLIKDNKIKFRISDKLKTLLLMAYSQNKLYDNKLHDIYLINPNWLNQYGYKKIKKLINDNYQQMQNINSNYTKLTTVYEITRYLNRHYLMEFSDKLIPINNNPSINFESIPEKLNLSNKYLLLFKDFIIVDKQIINHIEKSFGLCPNETNISFIYKSNEGCIIIIKEYPLNKSIPNLVENLIIFGNFNNNDNKFDIIYIFDFDDRNKMETELPYIVKNNIYTYISDRTYFGQNDKCNHYISPIIVNKEIIGNCYKYNENIDYKKISFNDVNNIINNNNLKNLVNIQNPQNSKNNNNNDINCLEIFDRNNNMNNFISSENQEKNKDNYKYINNKKLINSIYLYINGLYISSKNENVNYNNKIDEEFYIVKRKFIIDYKAYFRRKNNKNFKRGK